MHHILKYLTDSTKYTSTTEEVTKTLLCGYVLSGCDTVSYPFNQGKVRAAKVAMECVGKLKPLADYGDSTTIAGPDVE